MVLSASTRPMSPGTDIRTPSTTGKVAALFTGSSKYPIITTELRS